MTLPEGRLHKLAEAVTKVLGEKIIDLSVAFDEMSILVLRTDLLEVARLLRDDSALKFQQMMDVCGADFPSRPERFEIVYQFLSLTNNWRLRVKVETDELSPVPSLVSLYSSAGWFEREVWDMFGVAFAGNPDLRRILTDYGFEGHPLRKDFPLSGFTEVRYDVAQRRIVYEPVKLTQDYRGFDTLSPVEGRPVSAFDNGSDKT